MNNQKYIAVIGDLHASRLLKNRAETQKELVRNLEALNEKYGMDLASAFSISLGDSFQALLHIDAPFTQMLFELELNMVPVAIRFGIGLGEIATAIDPKNSQLNDGPAYHRARQAIDWIEDNEHQYANRKSNVLLLSDQSETLSDRLINAVFALNTAVKSKWTERQKEIIKVYLENNENQYQTAHALGIGQSSISKALKSTNFYTYQSSLEDIETYIQKTAES